MPEQDRHELLNYGYLHIKSFFSDSLINELELDYNLLLHKAEQINHKNLGGNKNNLVVTPELGNDILICRFEQITKNSYFIRNNIVPLLQQKLFDYTKNSFTIFKDKCNLKVSDGGAFTPHQDIVAYQHFKPRYYLTAAVLLDDSTIENGCLQMAHDYRTFLCEETKIVNTEIGEFPIYPYNDGGKHNGDIINDIANVFDWRFIEAQRGDIILFDAYVPHRSAKNLSKNTRRIYFFTFNLQSEGEYYDKYYLLKTQSPDDPIFHVSTPTNHK